MLSMFSRKPKSKSKHQKSNADCGMTVAGTGAGTTDSHECDLAQMLHYEKPRKHPSKSGRSHRGGKPRASSASPQPVASNRRVPGISVTFESTLPTQVWQASPSPSPPPLPLDGKLKLMNERMVSSLSDNWVEKPKLFTRPNSERRSRGRSDSNSFHNWVSDMDAEDSSEDSNHSGESSNASLSSCSSSDESLTGPDRTGEGKTSSSTTTVTTDSTSSLDLRMVSNSDGNLVHSVATASSRRNSVGQQNHHRKKDRSHRKSVSEKKRRNLPASAISSSSSSSDEDLEALGWDERTISALTNRNKSRQIANMRQSTTTQNLSAKFQRKSKESSTGSRSTQKDGTVGFIPNHNVGIQLQPLTPIRIDYEQTYVSNGVNHPQSCVLSRRAHKVPGEGHVHYLNRPMNQHAGESGGMAFSHTGKTNPRQGSDFLAVITADYKPLAEWEQQYKVIPVRKGDYVCVLSRPLKSRTCAAGVASQRTVRDRSSNGDAPDDANTWLYVRRWCVDHLIATGPPGFVPRNHCRLLASSELLQMWHQNQTTRTNRVTNGTTSAASNVTDGNGSMSISCARSPTEQDSLHGVCTRVHDNSVEYPSPSTTSSVSAQNRFPFGPYRPDFQRCPYAYPMGSVFVNHPQIPPPPPGFGSGGSLGSETEDRDSGRGPSSGSEWGSGRGGSSSVTLDHGAAEKTVSETGIERRSVPSEERTRNVKSAEESQLGWYAPDGSVWSSEPGSSNRDDGIYSHDSALQSPNDSDLTPQLLNRTLVHYTADADERPTMGQPVPTSPLTLTTRSSCTPVLEMRPGGTPTLYARGVPVSVLHGTDSLATSITTCATVIDAKHASEPEALASEHRTETPDPSCWEPYQTVIHVNENSLEKFTLV